MSFPKPAKPSHIIAHAGQGLSREQIYALLTSPSARSWIPGDDRSLHLLVCEDWVFKTHPDDRIANLILLLESIGKVSAFYERLGIWHPSKQWFVVWDGNHCWLSNATRRLKTIEEASSIRRFKAVFQILWFLLRAYLTARMVVDPQFENFATDGNATRLYYIDDEVYRWREGRFDGAHGLEVLEWLEP